nr:receptor-like protein EIX2 [Quercus suber]
MTVLSIAENRFWGTASSVCKIRGGILNFLDLSDNLLSGHLPNCFMHLRKLLILNLAGNNFTGKIPSSFGSLSQLHTLNLCWLKYLRILDLSANNISGTIPQCFNNFTAMAQKGDLFNGFIGSNYTDSYVYDYDDTQEFVNDATVIMKGRELEYGKYLGLLKIINLASNKLTGKVPSEISSLLEMVVLNISRNKLIGEIPQMIGQLKQLQSLDMSKNQFSNEIPSSMSELHFLSDLDLSYNNLSGKIPSGTQLQSFDAVDFTGNWALCGPPLPNKCPGEETPNQSDQPTDHDGYEDNEKDGDEFEKWFFAAAGFGFFVGFWGICGPLLFKSSWRGAYFLFLDNMKDWLYATKLAMCMKRLRRKF